MTERERHRAPSARTEPAVRRAWPWALSLSVHASLVIAAFFIVWTIAPREEPPPAVSVSFDAPDYAPLAPQPPAPVTPATEAASPILPPAAAPPDVADGALAALASLDRPEAPAPSVEPPGAPAPPPTLSLDRAPRPEIVFSGLGASSARSVVYVVDCSGSMLTTMPEVRAELRRSIQALGPTQRFQVLLFRNKGADNFVAAPLPRAAKKPVLIDAVPRNKKAVLEWVAGVDPEGASSPLPALEAAITLKPEAIFVLSAGGLTGPAGEDVSAQDVLGRLDRLNPADPETGRRRITIKTIQVIEEDPRAVLHAVGLAHGGKDGYRYISREEFNARAREKPGP